MIVQTMKLIAEEVEDFANHGIIAEEVEDFANHGINCWRNWRFCKPWD